MLKMIKSPNKPASNRNNNNKSASNRNNNSKLAFKKNDGDSEVYGFSIGKNGEKYVKKSGKLSKSRKLSKLGKSKSQKISKS